MDAFSKNSSTRRKLYTGMTLVILGLFLVSTVVWAAATFGTDTSTEPIWLNPGYEWHVEVDAISNPDKIVCLDYSVQNAGIADTKRCVCDDTIDPGDDCSKGTGHWTCTLDQDYPNDTINWSTGTWSAGGGGSCGALKTEAASDSTTTGPNAIMLKGLTARESPAGRPQNLAVLLLVGATILGASGAFLLRRFHL